MLIFYICLILIGGIACYALILEPHRLAEKHFLIRKNKKRVLDISNAYDMYTLESDIVLAHLSDFHFSRWFRPRRINKIIRSVMANNPDVIVFTGDLIDDYKYWPIKQTNKLVEKLSHLKAPMGKIAVLGNHDYKNGGHNFVKEVLKEAGFSVLLNESIFGADEKISLSISGVMDPSSNQARFSFDPTLAEWHILLLHQPDYIQKVQDLNSFDLVLSGHSHGGQIHLPFYRPKTNGAKRFTHGLYLPLGNTLLSVNTGIGTTLLPLRFGVPPQIVYYHLSNKQEMFEKVDRKYNRASYLKEKTVAKKAVKETVKKTPAPQQKPQPNQTTPRTVEETGKTPTNSIDKTSNVVDISLFRRRYEKKKTGS